MPIDGPRFYNTVVDTVLKRKNFRLVVADVIELDSKYRSYQGSLSMWSKKMVITIQCPVVA